MKPKFRSLVAAFAPLSRSSLIFCASLCSVSSLHAQTNGSWSLDGSGTWSTAGNWTGNTIADGADALADFSTLDFAAGAKTVTLDSARSIGALTFGDTNTATAATWALAGATPNILTLATTTGKPTITTGVDTNVNAGFVVAGTNGFAKEGGSVLRFFSNATTLTGDINVNGGTLAINRIGGNGSASANVGPGIINLANGTTFRLDSGGNSFSNNAVALVSGASATLSSANAANGYGGQVSGDATCTLNIANNTGQAFALGNSTGAGVPQLQNFLGLVNIPAGAAIRFSSTGGPNGNGSANATFNVDGNIFTRNNAGAGGVVLGAVTGSGTLSGQTNTTAGTVIYNIGAANLSTTFAGTFVNGGQGTSGLNKVGTGTLTLTGNSPGTGAASVTDGTLEVGNGGTTGSLSAATIAVAAGKNLVFNTSGTQTIPGIISGDGIITKKGSGRTNFNGVNTYTAGTLIEGGSIAVNADSGLGNAAGVVTFSSGTGKVATDAASTVLPATRLFTVATGVTGGFSAFDATDSLQVDGVVDGPGSLDIGGLGVVTLSGANTYLGNTTVTTGTLAVENGSGSATSSGTVSVTAGALAGGGSISGAVTIASGAGVKPGAVTPSSTAVGSLDTGDANLSGGSILYTEFANSSSYDQLVVTGNLTTPGASVGNPVLVDLRLENSVAKWTTLGTFNIIQYSGTFTGSANDLFEVTPASQQAGLIYSFAASGGFITLTIAGAPPSEWNVDSGGDWSVAGNWLNGVPNAPGTTANFGTVITAPVTVNNNASHTVGAIQFNNANSYTISGASALNLNSTTGNVQVGVLAGNHEIATDVSLADSVELTLANPASTITFSGDISGTGGFTNATAGSVVFSGSNTFNGPVDFSAGSLSFGTNGLSNGSLTLANSSLTWLTGNTEDVSNRAVTIGGTSVTLNTNGNDVSLANSIGNTGSGGIVKDGSGRLTFASTPTFTGTTTISGGTLQLGNGGSTGLVSGTITNNSALAINISDGGTLANLVTGTGSFSHLGSGTLTLTAQNTFSGETTIGSGSGVLLLSDSLNLQNSTVQLGASGGSIDFGTLTAATFGGLSGDKDLVLENSTPAALALTLGGNNQSTTYAGALSGAGSLIKVGTGILTLTGANTHTGNTAVNAGDLLLDAGGSIVGTSVTSLADANGFIQVQNGSLTADTVTLGRGSRGLLLNSGSVSVSGALSGVGSVGSTASAPIRVYGGTLSAGEIRLGRTGQNDTNEPVGAPADTNLYVLDGSVSVSGNLYVGTFDTQPNSSVVARIDGGSLTVGGAISVGLNNGGRWSYVDVNGGALVSTGTGVNSGLVLGGPFVGKSELLMRAGTATVERIQLGRDALSGMALVNVTGGELYVGSEGIMLGTSLTALNGLVRPEGEDAALIFRYEVRLSGGTLAAKADWSSSLPVNIGSLATSTIKTADAANNPFNITLNGAVTGTGSLEKTGGGILTLNGGNSHGGNTTVVGGTLAVSTSTFNDESNVAVALADSATLQLNYTGGDLVAGFLIDGVSQPDGIYGSLTNTTPGITQTAAITGTGLLYVNTPLTPASAYDAWATLKGLTVANNGANDDPDFDGFENQLEFALGGDPLSSTAVPPLVNLTVNATNFIFSFNRSDESEAEVTLAFEYGNNLTGWTPVVIGVDTATSGPEVSITENAASADAITVTIPKGVNTKLFGRIKSVK